MKAQIQREMFTSSNSEWATPPSVFDPLDAEFHFTLDACASDDNAKCDRYFDVELDGLTSAWSGVCWCNPPYGREQVKWIRKAHTEALVGHATTVMLIPSRPDSAIWHDVILPNAEVRWVRGRIKFVGAQWNAPFPSAVVIFRKKVTE